MDVDNEEEEEDTKEEYNLVQQNFKNENN